MSKQGAFTSLFIMLVAFPLMAQAPEQLPLTQEQVYNLVKQNKKNPAAVYKALGERGVDFDLNRDIESKLRRAGADDEMLQAIWRAGPTNRMARTALLTSATGASLESSYEEAMGFETIQDELDPDRRLRMVEEFETRFPNSQLLSYVYTQAAEAYQRKGNLEKLVEYAEKSLKLDPDNTFSLLMVAITVAQPRMLQGGPGVAEQRLSTSETYARRALQLIDKLPKRGNETDDQLRKRKSALASDAHTALGMVYMLRDDSKKAIEEFRTAIGLVERPNPQLYFRLGEVYANSGEKEKAIEAFTKASELGQGTVLQKFADERIAELKK